MTDNDLLLQWHPEKVAQLRKLIAQGKPYVWMLRLSQEEFALLEDAVRQSLKAARGSHRLFIDAAHALTTIIYLAEWHKRCYTGAEGDVSLLQLSYEERKQLWQASGVNIQTFVYDASSVADKTSLRWQESLQVLGGLAVQAELRRDDTDPLLGKLCRIYHGEDVDLSEVRDYQRAVAFRESIARKHSLYDYFSAILSDDPPFAPTDLVDSTSDFRRLISRIKDADRNVRRDKFAFEWRIVYSARHKKMVRSLVIKLRPEEIGGKYKEYIRYDRLRDFWDIAHPENIDRLSFAVRFKDGGKTIREVDFHNPLLVYTNTGSSFIATMPQSVAEVGEVVLTDIPLERFTRISIVMHFDDETRKVQDFECEPFLQVYSHPQTVNVWTSRRWPQVATAVIFSNAYRLKDEAMRESAVQLPFSYKDNTSEAVSWCPIYDTVTIVDDYGREHSFFNRNGHYQVLAKRYLNTIKYLDNIYALYKYVELSEDDDEEEIDEDDYAQENLPVLFGRDGLEVRYYPHNESTEWTPVESYELEFKVGGRYRPWTADEEPRQGKQWLRITIKGLSLIYKVYYVPFVKTPEHAEPIWRDFSTMTIRTALPGIADIKDNFQKDLTKSEPDVKTLTIGNKGEKLLLDIYRPVKLTELYQNSQLIHYYSNGDSIKLPLLTIRQFDVRNFSEKGVEMYHCGELEKGIYRFQKLAGTNLSYHLWNQSKKASELSESLPLGNVIVSLFTGEEASATDLYAWDYEHEPYPVKSFGDYPGITFQSLKDHPSPRDYVIPQENKDDDDEGWGDDDEEESVSATPFQAFRVAKAHHTYFFIFETLRLMAGRWSMVEDLLIPLIEVEGLDDDTTMELYRMAREFHFDWMLLDRNKYLSAIEDKDEETQETIKAGIIALFRSTPKCTGVDERNSLDDFLERYWTFTKNTSTDKLGQTAAKLILGDPEALGRNGSMDAFLEQFDSCRYKYSELSKTI